MSLPRRLSFVSDPAGLAIKQEPVITPLRTEHEAIRPTEGGKVRSSVQKAPFELDLQFSRPSEMIFGLRLYTDEQHWTEIGFDRSKEEFYIDRTKSGAAITADFPAKTTAPLVVSRPYDLKLVVDRSSIEAYAQNGTIAITNLIFPASDTSRVELFSASGKPMVVKGDLWKLRSIWE
jgi:sucrose-6-phosphate hydrolase SacC (GH32 family)